MPIALITVGLAVDLRKIVPDANEVLMLGLLEHLEDARVSRDGRLRQSAAESPNARSSMVTEPNRRSSQNR